MGRRQASELKIAPLAAVEDDDPARTALGSQQQRVCILASTWTGRRTARTIVSELSAENAVHEW